MSPNKPAYPKPAAPPRDMNNMRNCVVEGSDGVTMREFVTVESAKGIIANPATNPADMDYGKIANRASKMASAILKEMGYSV